MTTRSRIVRRLGALALATGLATGGALLAGASPASAVRYEGRCSDGVCGIYRNGQQIGIYSISSGRTVWF